MEGTALRLKKAVPIAAHQALPLGAKQTCFTEKPVLRALFRLDFELRRDPELTRYVKRRNGGGRGDLSGRLAGHVKQSAKEVVVSKVGPSVPVHD